MINTTITQHTEVVVKNFYGMKIERDPTYDEKLQNALAILGAKYCLAIPVRRVKNG